SSSQLQKEQKQLFAAPPVVASSLYSGFSFTPAFSAYHHLNHSGRYTGGPLHLGIESSSGKRKKKVQLRVLAMDETGKMIPSAERVDISIKGPETVRSATAERMGDYLVIEFETTEPFLVEEEQRRSRPSNNNNNNSSNNNGGASI